MIGGQAAKAAFTFEQIPVEYYPVEVGFRPKTPMLPLHMNFVFLNGGAGDYFCWLQPIRWLADQAVWIHGTLVVPTYLKEIAEHFITPYKHWRVKTYKELQEIPKADDMPFRGPVILHQESLNATGAHLATCGWVYFTNKEKAPDGNSERVPEGWWSYPQFKQEYLDSIELPTEMGLKPRSYIVLTTGTTTPSRDVPGQYWNPIIEHIRSRGLTPVFLGKSVVVTGNLKNIHTVWKPEIEYGKGLDLRDKTSLTQAAAIMSNAAAVVGHDNGLLHLAGCTPSVPIVFGYNLASPEHREPRRPAGRIYNVILDDKELSCYFCQSKTNFVIGYNFRQCRYADNKCIDMLFDNEGARWKKQIDLALAETT